MSTLAEIERAPTAPEGTGWSLWRRQVEGIVRLELRKSQRGGRAIPLLLLAALPVVLLVLFSLAPLSAEDREAVVPMTVFAFVFRLYYLKIGIFLGCLVAFIQLFRGDMMERSLHYYLLCPVRREVLVAAKYLVGLVTTGVVLAASTAASFLVLHLSFADSLGGGALFAHLARYCGITVLGCAGYGAVFMLAGLFFRNPVVPALVLFLWELINPFLGPLLKKVSVIYYLISLLPVPVSSQALQVLSSSISPWLSVPGLVLVTAAAVAVAGFRLRRTEIRYSED
ncbi:MAG: ABC transporter permease [Acidobacteria bacterium]|nr:ABC transporter permease [Acidobacteriota bacterium]